MHIQKRYETDTEFKADSISGYCEPKFQSENQNPSGHLTLATTFSQNPLKMADAVLESIAKQADTLQNTNFIMNQTRIHRFIARVKEALESIQQFKTQFLLSETDEKQIYQLQV